MDISPVFFYLFAGVAIASALLVVIKRNPVSNALSLVLMLFAFAGLYAALDAHLLAALQILVYAGAVMVLFVFVIMLLNAATPSFDFARSSRTLRIAVVTVGTGIFMILAKAFKTATFAPEQGPFTREAVEAAGGNTRVIAELMFSDYILPFELTSVLLLAAIVAVVAIAMRKKKIELQRSGQ